MNATTPGSQPGPEPGLPAPPTLVLVHGAANDRRAFAPLVQRLATQGRAAWCPDLPGHGQTPGPACSHVESMARWLLQALRVAGLRHVVLGGHSMGSLVALHAASLALQAAGGDDETGCEPRLHVAQLWLLGTAWPMRVAPALLEEALAQPAAAVERIVGWSHASTDESLRARTRALMLDQLRADPALLHTDLAACHAYTGAADAAAVVRRAGCPVHVVMGDQDRMTPPRAAQALVEQLAARAHVVAAGHALMAEAPDALLGALQDARFGARLNARLDAIVPAPAPAPGPAPSLGTGTAK